MQTDKSIELVRVMRESFQIIAAAIQQATSTSYVVEFAVEFAEETPTTQCWADGPRGECRREATTSLGLCYLHERQLKR